MSCATSTSKHRPLLLKSLHPINHNNMNASSTDDLIASLESLCTQLQEAAGQSAASASAALPGAVAAAGAAIAGAMQGEERRAWEAELETVAAGDVPACGGCRERAGAQPVPCIHACGVLFCSATCRRKAARVHRGACGALAKRALLKRLGLGGSEELF